MPPGGGQPGGALWVAGAGAKGAGPADPTAWSGDEHERVLQTAVGSTHPCPADIGFVGGARVRMGGRRGRRKLVSAWRPLGGVVEQAGLSGPRRPGDGWARTRQSDGISC